MTTRARWAVFAGREARDGMNESWMREGNGDGSAWVVCIREEERGMTKRCRGKIIWLDLDLEEDVVYGRFYIASSATYISLQAVNPDDEKAKDEMYGSRLSRII